MSLPTEIPDEILDILGYLSSSQDEIEGLRGGLDAAMRTRDQYIAELRTAGWTLEQVSTYTGLSVGAIRKICRQQGVVTERVTRIQGSEDAATE